MSAPAQRSFAGGEVAPALYARTDQVKYATGLRACRNHFVRRHGGATLRPGTGLVAESKNSAVACRMIPFIRDATNIGDTYIIELGQGYARFYQNGGAIVTSGVAAWATTTAYLVGDLVTQGGYTFYCFLAHTSATGTDKPGVDAAFTTKWYALTGSIYEIPTPYATADLADVVFSQVGDIITLAHPSYATRELRRYAHTRWTLTPISFGPSIAAPANIASSGGGAGTIRYWAVTAIKESTLEESLPGLYSHTDRIPSASAPVSLTWDAVPGAISYNVYRSTDGQTYGLINSAGGNPVAVSDATWTDADETATSDVADVWAAAAGQLRNPMGAITATIRAYDAQYTVTITATLVGGGDGSGSKIGEPTPTYGRFLVYYARDGETRVLAAVSDVLVVEGAVTAGPTAMSVTITVPDNGYAALVIDVVPEVMPTVDGQTCTMNVNAGSGVISWKGGVSGFADAGAIADPSIAPPAEPTLFAAGSYPAATTNYQQRRIFGNTAPSPDTVWASRIGSPTSFVKSTPLQDDDMVQFALQGQLVQVVKHLMDLGRLLVFTTAGVFQCGDADGVLTPTTPNPREIDGQGIGRLRPLKVSDSALFVEGRGGIVRDLQPWSAGGALGGYSGKDLTVFAAHLFDGFTIVDWAYAKIPNSIIFAVRSDGVLLGLTYLREHEVWGWHRHDTDGFFENVCVVPEGSEDAVYVVVRRTINGVTKRFVERFKSRFFTSPEAAFFMDCGLSYDGRNTSASVTVRLSGGTAWDQTEILTVDVVGDTLFSSSSVGDAVVFTAADGTTLECVIATYVSAARVTARPTKSVPADLQGIATTAWTLAVRRVGGLTHLEGKLVSVLGDGHVVASPNNSAYDARRVTAGVLTLDRPYGVIHVGLPYIGDVETLDLDTPGPRSIKDKKQLVNKVGLFVEASRGIWAGISAKVTAAAPLAGLQERKGRQLEDFDAPPTAATEYFEITIDNSWDNNGGVLIRQVDPLPLTVLAAVPIGWTGGA